MDAYKQKLIQSLFTPPKMSAPTIMADYYAPPPIGKGGTTPPDKTGSISDFAHSAAAGVNLAAVLNEMISGQGGMTGVGVTTDPSSYKTPYQPDGDVLAPPAYRYSTHGATPYTTPSSAIALFGDTMPAAISNIVYQRGPSTTPPDGDFPGVQTPSAIPPAINQANMMQWDPVYQRFLSSDQMGGGR